MRFGWLEILLIIVLVFLLFGANKFPDMMKNLAQGLKVFRKEVKTDDAKDHQAPKAKKPSVRKKQKKK